MEFYRLLEDFLRQINRMNSQEPLVDQVWAAVEPLCRFLRVEKIEGVFYNGVRQERAGKGEEHICFDTGRESEERLHNRIMADSMTVAHFGIFQAVDAEPWTEEELARIEMIQQTIVTNVSRIRLERQVEYYTYFDNDGYHNLRFYFRELQKYAMKDQLEGRVAVFFNLKHYSMVNQQIGRSAGNLVMRNFYERLSELLTDGGIVSRLGGDNFILLCEKPVLRFVLDYLKGTMVTYDVNSNSRILVQATAGVYVIPSGFVLRDPGDILDKILAAGSAARHNGGEEIVYYNENLEGDRDRAAQIQRMFPEALRKKEFRVFYQPKVDLVRNELAGAEALCRWFHDGKIIPPLDFIPLLERNTDICKLDFYMLDMVCQDIRRWLDEGKQVVRVSVNLSRKHMLDADLLEHILDIVDRNHVPHQYLEIELTETTTDVEFRDLKRVVNGLQRAGISTSVDDFGIGYSSLNLIRDIPWNVLKVDKSFLPGDDETDESVRSIMFRYVVAMAKALGLECIAEGVETPMQVDVLRKNNCEMAQGFYYDRPLPQDEFEDRLEHHTYVMGQPDKK